MELGKYGNKMFDDTAFYQPLSDFDVKANFGKNTKEDIFTPPTKDECEKALNKFKTNVYSCTKLSNGVLLFGEINIDDVGKILRGYKDGYNLKNALSVMKDKGLFDAVRQGELYEKFKNNELMLGFYVYKGKIYAALIPVNVYQDYDYKQGMWKYYAGIYRKDVVKTADSINEKYNLPNSAYNLIWSPIDKVFYEGAPGWFPEDSTRYFAYIGYSCFKTAVFAWLLSKCPIVAAYAGGFYLASLTLHVIFDFRGMTEVFERGNPEEICTFLGTVIGLLSSWRSISKAGKDSAVTKISIVRGKLKLETIKGDVAQQVAKDTGKNAEELQGGATKGSKASQARASAREALNEETRQLRDRLRKEYNYAKDISTKEMLKVADNALKAKQYGLSSKFYAGTAKVIFSSSNPSYLQVAKIYNNLTKIVWENKNSLSNLRKVEKMIKNCGNEKLIHLIERQLKECYELDVVF